MEQYIFMGIILALMIIGMIAAYYYGKYTERKRIINELTKTGVDFDGDTISTISLARVVLNNPKIRTDKDDSDL